MDGGGYAVALRELRRAQKPPHGTPAYSRFVNRPAGRLLAAAAFTAGLTPNQVSTISAVFTFSGIAALCLFPLTHLWGVLLAVLLVLGYALDSADGQVARLRGGGSRVGEWLDHMIDCWKVASIHLAVLVQIYRFHDSPSAWQLGMPLAFAVVGVVLYFGLMLSDQLRRAAAGGMRPQQGSLSIARAMAILPSDFGAIALVLGTIGWPRLFFPLYGTMLVGHAALLGAATVKWYRVLRALDEADTAPTLTPSEERA